MPNLDELIKQSGLSEDTHDGGNLDELIAKSGLKEDSNSQPQWKKTLSDIVHPVAQSLGMIGGGLVGGTAGTFGAGPVGTAAGSVAGATLGYAGGEQVANKVDELTGYRKPKSLSQELIGVGKDIVTGAETEMTGQIGGKIIGKTIDLFGKRPSSPNMSQRVEISDKLKSKGGKGLTPAEITQNPALQMTESALEKNISSAGKIRAFRQSNIEAANKIKEDAIEALGGRTTKEAAGEIVQTTTKANERAWRDLSDAAYSEVEKFIPKGEPVPTPKLSEVANDIATELAQSRLARGDMLSVMDKLRERAGIFKQGKPTITTVTDSPILNESGVPFTHEATKKGFPSEYKPFQDVTWTGLHMDRKWLTSEISQAYKAGDNFKAMTYGKLKSAIDADIEEYSKSLGGGAKEAFDWANNLYRAGASVFKDKTIIANVVRNASPEKIASQFIKPNNVSSLKTLKSAIGDEGMQPLKQTWFESLVSKGDEQSFSLAKFATAWNKYDKPTLSAFLKESEIQAGDELAKISRVLGEVEKQSGNPSGTARIGGVLLTGYEMMKNPVFTSMRLMGANRFAEHYLNNPTFRKYAIEGFKLSAESEQAIAMANKLTTIAGTQKDREPQSESGQQTGEPLTDMDEKTISLLKGKPAGYYKVNGKKIRWDVTE